MSYYDLCSTAPGGICCPQLLADIGNAPCVRQCPDSMMLNQPPPSVVTIPGPTISSFPQDSVVGSTGAPVPGGSFGYGGSSWGSGGFNGYGRVYGSGSSSPYSYWHSRYHRGSC